MSVNVNLRSILESNKLIGYNFFDWLRNIKIILHSEITLFILDEAVLEVVGFEGWILCNIDHKHNKDAYVFTSRPNV